ncbi:ECF transporter S component [Butyrivibrio sp. XB500-5]|uniref:ECF transporter S component n=1 Tax=Butyrivibrio sp. XB500-5 TaxID=2364880 RepID=UPI000EAABBB1|nr:ECF transporter S component [Butyrivibrio sp. XB500-5]RKM63253.1 ECF transporter S component [Butyrivibrio sp. XB500-5]
MENERKFGTGQIAITAVLLAICIISQVFKNLSVFITGPIINACIALAVLMVNLPCGIVLSIITPITAYFIAASPVMAAVPAMIVFIMLGNIVLAVLTEVLLKKPFKHGGNVFKIPNMVKAVLISFAKGVFMGLTISLWLLPTFIPADSPMRGKLPVFQRTFSLYQFLTACIGFVYVFIIYTALRKSETNFQKSDS